MEDYSDESDSSTTSSSGFSESDDSSDDEDDGISLIGPVCDTLTLGPIPAKKTNNNCKKRVTFPTPENMVLVYEIPSRRDLGLKSIYSDSDDESDDEDDEDEDEDISVSGRGFVARTTAKGSYECRRYAKKTVNKVAKLIDVHHSINSLTVRDAQTKQKSRRRGKRSNSRTKLERKERRKKGKSGSFFDEGITPDEETSPKCDKKTLKGIKNVAKTYARETEARRKRRTMKEQESKQSSNNCKMDVNSNRANYRVSLYRKDLRPSVVTLDPYNGGISVNGKRMNGSSGPAPPPKILPRENKTSDNLVMQSNRNLISKDVEKPGLKTVLSSNSDYETLRRLDPRNMNISNRRFYAWQIANGNISSHQLTTPSIHPMWDGINNVPEYSAVKTSL